MQCGLTCGCGGLGDDDIRRSYIKLDFTAALFQHFGWKEVVKWKFPKVNSSFSQVLKLELIFFPIPLKSSTEFNVRKVNEIHPV